MAQLYTRIEGILGALGVPYAYRVHKGKNVPAPPYAVWYIERERYYGSDSVNNIRESHVVIELYTARKERELEERIEEAFGEYELEKEENSDCADEVYQIVYTMTITTKIRR